MAGLQVGQALGCSGCLGLGSAVPVPPMFLGTQPSYATKALRCIREPKTGRHNGLEDCCQEIYPTSVFHLVQFTFGLEQSQVHK